EPGYATDDDGQGRRDGDRHPGRERRGERTFPPWPRRFLDRGGNRRPDTSRRYVFVEGARRASNLREVGDERLAADTPRQMRLECRESWIGRARPVCRSRPIDIFVEHVVVESAVHWLKIARSLIRALCTCDFDVPSDTPRIVATSRCSNPST